MRINCRVCKGTGCPDCKGTGKVKAVPNPELTALLLGMAADEETRSRDNYTRSLIPYPGNKFESLKHIIPRFPPAKKFIDACGGSGVVTLNLQERYDLRVFNDKHAGVTAFFRCIREPEKLTKFVERLDLTCHSREEFIWCRDSWQNCQDDVERAARWYYSLHHSFSSIGRHFARTTNLKSQHDAALHAKLPLFREVYSGFRGVQVENLDVLQCIRDYCDGESVTYIDPDYIDCDPSIYEHKVQHIPMLELVFSIPGFFAVSGYANDLYDSYPWTDRITWNVQSSIRGKAFETSTLQGKENVMNRWETREEVLWIKDFD